MTVHVTGRHGGRAESTGSVSAQWWSGGLRLRHTSVGSSGSTNKISGPLLSCFDVHDVEPQHLSWQRVVNYACNDLLSIRCDLAIINLSIVAIRDPDDNS
jgi:hypothetical protein